MEGIASIAKETIQKNIIRSKDYFGLNEYVPTQLGKSLHDAIEENGAEILLDNEKLENALKKLGVSTNDINRICLLCNVSTFRELVEKGSASKQIDIDRFVYNAVRQTGLTRDVIMDITSDILVAADIAPAVGIHDASDNNFAKIKSAYTIPLRYYQSELKTIEKEFLNWESNSAEISEECLNRLRPLADADLPDAKYYLGYYLLRKYQQLGEDKLSPQYDTALQLLKDAASAGHQKAASALADCYYYGIGVKSDWSKAYSYYTGYGALALDRSKRAAFLNIVNHKKYNQKMLVLCAILLIVLIAFSIAFFPGMPVYGKHIVFGVLAAILNTAVYVAACVRYKSKPYSNLNALAPTMILIWGLFMVIRVFFN